MGTALPGTIYLTPQISPYKLELFAEVPMAYLDDSNSNIDWSVLDRALDYNRKMGRQDPVSSAFDRVANMSTEDIQNFLRDNDRH